MPSVTAYYDERSSPMWCLFYLIRTWCKKGIVPCLIEQVASHVPKSVFKSTISNVISKIKGIKIEINEFVHIVSYEFYLINKKATNFRPVSIICINRTFNMEYGILILHIQHLAGFMFYLQPVIYTTLCNLYRYNCSSGHTICWTVYYTVYAHNFTLTEAIEFYSEHEFFVKSSTFKLLTVVIQQRWGFS